MRAGQDDRVRAGTVEELQAKGRMVVRGRRCPILVVHDQGRVFAMDNRCPHLGFPLHRGSVADGILTCHWHHARFDLASGCTFDLWADDVPTFPVELHDGEVWVKDVPGHADPAAHWRRRLDDGLAHNLSLMIAKSAHGLLAAGVPPAEILRQAALFGARHRDGWGIGLTILTALGNLLPLLPAEETYLALFHGLRRVAADCADRPPRRDRAPLAPAPEVATLKRWLRHWSAVATATAPSAPCLRRSRPAHQRTLWPTSCSRPRPTACLPTAATRSTSSTRRSSASI
jgi:nitrite reductase/ring-hydroxylating ferredoxin subunit